MKTMMPLDDRFWEKVNKTNTCWLWTSSKNLKGYGNFSFFGKTRTAHTVSWFLKYKKMPTYLMHKCSVRACVRPSHLKEGTHVANMQQAVLEGKFRKRLTLEQARKIKQLLSQKTRTMQSIADEFEVALNTVGAIKYGKAWKTA
jgi:hypothetical protein